MRARNIKPGFCSNEVLGQMSPLARLLFIGLWMMADREGRLEDRPARIKAEALPYDKVEIEKLLEVLGKLPEPNGAFISRYQVNGQRYIQINNFVKHQNPHKNEKQSEIPPPSLATVAVPAVYPVKDGTALVIDGTARADSLIPDSLIPDSKPKPIWSFQKQNDQAPPSTSQKPLVLKGKLVLTAEGKEAFVRFWKSYPRKVARAAAEKAFAKVHPDRVLFGAMMAAVERAKHSDEWNKDGGQFIPHPATWLNGRRWEDEIETVIQQEVPQADDFSDCLPSEKEVDPVKLEANREKLKTIFRDLGHAKGMPA